MGQENKKYYWFFFYYVVDIFSNLICFRRWNSVANDKANESVLSGKIFAEIQRLQTLQCRIWELRPAVGFIVDFRENLCFLSLSFTSSKKPLKFECAPVKKLHGGYLIFSANLESFAASNFVHTQQRSPCNWVSGIFRVLFLISVFGAPLFVGYIGNCICLSGL